MKRSLERFIAETGSDIGCRIDLIWKWQPGNDTGIIRYHNPGLWTITLRPQGWNALEQLYDRTAFKGSRRDIWTLYAYYYIREQIHLDRLAMRRECPEGYLEGLAVLHRISQREEQGYTWLTHVRIKDSFHWRRNLTITPEVIYCDWKAIINTVGFLSRHCCDETKYQWLMEIYAQMTLFSRMPETVWGKDGKPCRMVPYYAHSWKKLLEKADNLALRYPFFRRMKGKGYQNRETMYSAMLESGDETLCALALRLAVLGGVDETALRNSPLCWERLYEAADAYCGSSVAYICNLPHPSKMLADNRLAVERTAREVNEWMIRNSIAHRSGTIHSLGRR